MRITTRSAIDISESFATYLLASHFWVDKDRDAVFEKRLSYVTTGKYSIADLYLPTDSIAIEMKSTSHGNSALKGVVQASMYKEQAENAIFCMQKPRRSALANGIEEFSRAHGVGVIWLDGIPTICADDMVSEATGGNSKPFRMWKKRRYTSTRLNIENNSQTAWIDEYLDTIEQIVSERSDEIFDFAVEPDPNIGGFSDIY